MARNNLEANEENKKFDLTRQDGDLSEVFISGPCFRDLEVTKHVRISNVNILGEQKIIISVSEQPWSNLGL